MAAPGASHLIVATLVSSVLAVLVSGCGGSGSPARAAELDPEVAQLVDWIAAHRDDVSLLVYSVSAEGRRDVVALNEAVPRFLASTAKLVLLGAYAREVAAGRLRADEAVPVDEIEEWYLPGSDGGAHEAALKAAGVAPGGMIRLDEVVRAMIEFSDNAATDYLLHRLGLNAIADAVREMGMSGQRLPLRPSLGASLALADPSLGATPLERARRLAALPAGERADRESSLARAYGRDPRPLQAAYARAVAELGASQAGLEAQLEIAPLLVDWQGTAADYARLLEVAGGRLISPGAAEIVRRHLATWAARGGMTASFREAGGKDGLAPGVRTIAAYGIPREGEYAGERRVVVVFLNRLDARAFLSLLQSEAFEKLVTRLALDRELAEHLRRLVERAGS